MSGWNLNLFMGAVHDFERAQYEIMSRLQHTRRAFSNNCIFPDLGELIHLYGTLQTIVTQSETLRQALPKQLKGIDLEKQEVVYESEALDARQLGVVEELIHWAMPHVQAAIEEGRTIFEFVEEHLTMEEVGLVPSYLQEGYLLVPDRAGRCLYVLQYSLSIFTGADERFRSLRTTLVKTIDQHPATASPRDVKLELLAERRELPNPATYFVGTDLDFPFEPTMLPVAKRKLMQHLFTADGKA